MNKIKEKSFITRPALWCIEINAHALLYIVLLVIDGKLPIEALNTYLFTSQPCENMFCIARSLSGPYSSVRNFSVKTFSTICEKIFIINLLKTHEGQDEKYHLHFPQHHKSENNAHDYATRIAGQLSLTYYDPERIINDAFTSAKNDVEFVKMEAMVIRRNFHSLSELSRYVKNHLSKSSSSLSITFETMVLGLKTMRVMLPAIQMKKMRKMTTRIPFVTMTAKSLAIMKTIMLTTKTKKFKTKNTTFLLTI